MFSDVQKGAKKRLFEKWGGIIINNIKQLKDPSQIADNIASHITATISEKQQIFENIDDLRNHLDSVSITKCDEILFSLMGFSLANINAIISFVLVLINKIIKFGKTFLFIFPCFKN